MKILTHDFNSLEYELDRRETYPEVSDNLQQSLSRLMGYDNLFETWRALKADPEGRLLVGEKRVLQGKAVISSPTVTTIASRILLAKDTRVKVMIFNLVAFPMYIGFDATISTANSFPLMGDSVYIETQYIGDFYAFYTLGSAPITIVEYS